MNAGSLVSAVVPQEIVDAPPGVTTSVEGTRAVLTLACYVLACVALSLWASHRRDVTRRLDFVGGGGGKGRMGTCCAALRTSTAAGWGSTWLDAWRWHDGDPHPPRLRGPGDPLAAAAGGRRASALFAVLAGVSLSLTTGREHPVHGRERIARSCLAVQAPLIALLGMYLATLDTNVAIILTYYGLLFLLGIPLPGLGSRACSDLRADGGARASRQSSAPAWSLPA